MCDIARDDVEIGDLNLPYLITRGRIVSLAVDSQAEETRHSFADNMAIPVAVPPVIARTVPASTVRTREWDLM